MEKAYKTLKPSSFALYLYLASQEGNTLALGAVLIEQVLGIKKSAYHMAVNELEENGYLKKEEGNLLFSQPNRISNKSNV